MGFTLFRGKACGEARTQRSRREEPIFPAGALHHHPGLHFRDGFEAPVHVCPVLLFEEVAAVVGLGILTWTAVLWALLTLAGAAGEAIRGAASSAGGADWASLDAFTSSY